ncbi:hypothetical protein QM797_15950 [Rhodococcus sp. IEGM 1381]|nr:hypothetical protein [Rhodococcus sp. IEGM 1381]MDI9896219.1 hypothetical protein [Rhodococcus sp. IEGM 1381]
MTSDYAAKDPDRWFAPGMWAHFYICRILRVEIPALDGPAEPPTLA